MYIFWVGIALTVALLGYLIGLFCGANLERNNSMSKILDGGKDHRGEAFVNFKKVEDVADPSGKRINLGVTYDEQMNMARAIMMLLQETTKLREAVIFLKKGQDKLYKKLEEKND